MKNKIAKQLFLSFSLLGMISVSTPISQTQILPFSESTIDLFNNQNQVISLGKKGKVIGEEEVDVSQTFVQYGLGSNGRYCIRFATAVKGNILKIEYTRKVLDSTKVVELTSLYRGISTEGKTVYFNGNELTENVAESGKYYWACYTIEFLEESTYKDTIFEAFVTVTYVKETEEKTITSSNKRASLNGLLNEQTAPNFVLTNNGEVVSETVYKSLNDNPNEIALPTVKAEDNFGNEIIPEVVYKFNNELSVDPGYSTETWTKGQYNVGTHSWTFIAKDPTTELVSEETITLNVYPRILADGRGGSYQISVKDELSNSPEIYSANNGIEARCFNMEPSKNYYVEAEFTKPEVAGTGSGFIHSMPNTNSGGFIREALYTGNLRTADMVKGVNFGSAGNYYTIWNASSNKRQHLGGTEGFNIDSFATEETTKLAIARRENTYYFWMNDILLEKYVSTDFNNQETIPGILCQGWKTGIDGTKAKNIYFCNEDEAINKIASLESTFAPYGYVRNDNDTYNSGSYENGILTYTTAAGQQYYNSIVGSNVLLKGNTHISFRFDATSYNVGGDDYSMFYLSKLDTGFAGDPNARTSKIASWAMVHANSYNTTVRASASQVESPWSYEKKFNGNGNEYKWDVKTWDVDIKTRIENDGSIKITYKFTEVAKANGAVSNPASYEETMTSGIKMPGSGMNTSWYGLFFQGHNKNSFTISNLVMEPLID